MATRTVGVESGKGDDVMVARAREQQADLRAAVTAVLPAVKAGMVNSREALQSALSASGIGRGSDRDLALLAGAVSTAQAFALLGEVLGADPEDVWAGYCAETA